jgi:hypothetical protein
MQVASSKELRHQLLTCKEKKVINEVYLNSVNKEHALNRLKA